MARSGEELSRLSEEMIGERRVSRVALDAAIGIAIILLPLIVSAIVVALLSVPDPYRSIVELASLAGCIGWIIALATDVGRDSGKKPRGRKDREYRGIYIPWSDKWIDDEVLNISVVNARINIDHARHIFFECVADRELDPFKMYRAIKASFRLGALASLLFTWAGIALLEIASGESQAYQGAESTVSGELIAHRGGDPEDS